MTRESRETLQYIVDVNLQRIADLEAQYGTGVRPAWVGEEIGVLQGVVDRARDMLAGASK